MSRGRGRADEQRAREEGQRGVEGEMRRRERGRGEMAVSHEWRERGGGNSAGRKRGEEQRDRETHKLEEMRRRRREASDRSHTVALHGLSSDGTAHPLALHRASCFMLHAQEGTQVAPGHPGNRTTTHRQSASHWNSPSPPLISPSLASPLLAACFGLHE